jgi:hypothetical protein
MDTTQVFHRSRDADRGGVLPLSAVWRDRFLPVIPPLCALAYPSLSSLLSAGLVAAHGSSSPNGVILWVAVIASLALALAVMLVSFAFALALGSRHGSGNDGYYARGIAHLAFATPSLYVGFANVAGVMHAPSAAPIAWLIFWALVSITVLAAGSSRAKPVATRTVVHPRLAIAHGISASAILLLLILPHIANHIVGLWNGRTHIEMMRAVRYLYRDDIVQPILLALIGFQILSGIALVRRRMTSPSDFLGNLQTMSGAYVGIYFLAHMTAVFAARHAGTDTNWNWLTNNDTGMLVSLSSLRLIAHYWVGPIAIAVHLGCGLRMLLLRREVPALIADRVIAVVVSTGVAASSVILVALFSLHID